jgi:hypothetical protein
MDERNDRKTSGKGCCSDARAADICPEVRRPAGNALRGRDAERARSGGQTGETGREEMRKGIRIVVAALVAGALVASGPAALADKKHRDKKGPASAFVAASSVVSSGTR